MELIKVMGSLGNQMFIYAFYLRVKNSFPDVLTAFSDTVLIYSENWVKIATD